VRRINPALNALARTPTACFLKSLTSRSWYQSHKALTTCSRVRDPSHRHIITTLAAFNR